MMDQTDTADTRPWWDRALDPVIDFLEEHILDPVDVVVTPRVERYQARTAYRLVRRARTYAAKRTLRCWRFDHHTRSRLLSTWSGLESALAHARYGLHEQHAGRLDNSDACCSADIRAHHDRAEVLRALAVVETQTAHRVPGRQPSLEALPGRIRRIAGQRIEELVYTMSSAERAVVARGLHEVLEPEFGLAADPVASLYIS